MHLLIISIIRPIVSDSVSGNDAMQCMLIDSRYILARD